MARLKNSFPSSKTMNCNGRPQPCFRAQTARRRSRWKASGPPRCRLSLRKPVQESAARSFCVNSPPWARKLVASSGFFWIQVERQRPRLINKFSTLQLIRLAQLHRCSRGVCSRWLKRGLLVTERIGLVHIRAFGLSWEFGIWK